FFGFRRRLPFDGSFCRPAGVSPSREERRCPKTERSVAEAAADGENEESPRSDRRGDFKRRARTLGLPAKARSGLVSHSHKSLLRASRLLRHMNVIAVGGEQRVADVFPRPFFSRPRTKQLDRIPVGLSPAAVHLHRFVEPP